MKQEIDNEEWGISTGFMNAFCAFLIVVSVQSISSEIIYTYLKSTFG